MGLSGVLDAADGVALDLGPVDGLVECLVDQTYEADVITTDNVHAQGDLDGVLDIIRLPYATFNAVLKNLFELE